MREFCYGRHGIQWYPKTYTGGGIRVEKFDPKVGSWRTTKIKNLVVLIIILVVLILSLYYICMWY